MWSYQFAITSMTRLRIVLASLGLLLPAGVASAAAKPDNCVYVEIAKLPIKYAGRGLVPTIPGTINGKPARLLVDTGADMIALTRGFAEKLGGKLEATGRRAIGVGGATDIYGVPIDDMSVGPTRSGPTTVRVIGETGSVPSFDAIVGAPFLLQTDLEISLADRELKFYRPHDCNTGFFGDWNDSFLGNWNGADVSVLPYSWRTRGHPNPHFSVEINGTKIDAMIDSGASTTVIELEAARRAGLQLDAPTVKKLDDATGIGKKTVSYWSAHFDKLVIGDEIIQNARIGVMDSAVRDVEMLIGRDFLRTHRVLFAGSQKKLYIAYVGGGNVFVSHQTRIEPWQQREADEGNPDAEAFLASVYASGELAAKDPAAARHWLDRAADHGHLGAQLALGRRLMLQGQDAAAAPRLRAALDQMADSRQVALWLYIARMRANQAALGQQELDAAFKPVKAWPAPVAQYFLGHLDADALFARAAQDTGEPSGQAKLRTCHSAASVADLLAAQGKQAASNAVIAAHADCKLVPRPALAAAGSVAPALDLTIDMLDDASGE
jgi:predicted aspartyl protease